MKDSCIALNGISFEVRRSARRKNIAAGIDGGGYFIAAPQHMPYKELEAVLQKDFERIIKKLGKRPDACRKEHSYTDGDLFFCRGELYPLRITDGPLRFDGESFISAPFKDRASAHDAFAHFYARRTRNLLQEEFPPLCKKIGAGPRRVNVKDVRSIWGSCSSSGGMTFSLRLAMLPAHLMEYVIIHELCHIFVMNHSPAFWSLVSQYCPDWGERRAELRRCGSMYSC